MERAPFLSVDVPMIRIAAEKGEGGLYLYDPRHSEERSDEESALVRMPIGADPSLRSELALSCRVLSKPTRADSSLRSE